MRHRKLRYAFLIGILCGAMLAAGFTFALTIPATNDHWRVEITKRGGGAWYFDQNGKLDWMWMAQPVSERSHSGPRIVVPRSQQSADSSLERL